MLLTVLITFQDDTTDVKECWDVSDICLDNVKELKIIRSEKVA